MVDDLGIFTKALIESETASIVEFAKLGYPLGDIAKRLQAHVEQGDGLIGDVRW